MTTIAIVDNDLFALRMLARTIGRALPGARILWTATTGGAAVHHCLGEDEAVPDVLVMDMSLTDMDGAEACRRIREASARPAMLTITSYSPNHYRRMAADAGAQGLVGKDATPRELADAVRLVAGGTPMEGFRTADAAYAAMSEAAGRNAALSARERQVLERYARNRSTEEIADELGIRPSTVFVVMRRARLKLGASSRAEAIRLFLGEDRRRP
ncbi:response regulator transcription factor [Bifidobacterium saguinibicoloris]|uniref:response regulator transcription factor n=1 Tax=Bifidobacterium saguinibicoloris TaxID=2834433 RepID=UPI001C5662D7|nr:response regulator transcription factor [Bifidobacterium saguinibicoloris]MBW3080606.1 response regulator transcription factor [Bifidobacterium saguinibicoloris]